MGSFCCVVGRLMDGWKIGLQISCDVFLFAFWVSGEMDGQIK